MSRRVAEGRTRSATFRRRVRRVMSERCLGATLATLGTGRRRDAWVGTLAERARVARATTRPAIALSPSAKRGPVVRQIGRRAVGMNRGTEAAAAEPLAGISATCDGRSDRTFTDHRP